MIILAIDTTLAACSAAVFDVDQNKILANAYVPMDKGHGEALAPMAEACLKKAVIRPEAITRIVVTIGPGTFTGVRIGLALAHGMATALGCETVGLNSLKATAAALFVDHPQVCVVHQAGATGKFYAGIVSPESLDEAVCFATLEDCIALAEGLPLIGTGADAILAATTRAIRITDHDLPDAVRIAPFAARLKPAADLPQPLYVREPDARPSAPAPSIVIRTYHAADLAIMARLHGMGFDAAWDKASLTSALALPGSGAFVAELEGTVRGFVQFQIAADEAEINTICTEPRWRGRGLAGQLLDAVRHELHARQITRLHLEVAEDNSVARALYAARGFQLTGRRKQYYSRKNGVKVDALLLSLAP